MGINNLLALLFVVAVVVIALLLPVVDVFGFVVMREAGITSCSCCCCCNETKWN